MKTFKFLILNLSIFKIRRKYDTMRIIFTILTFIFLIQNLKAVETLCLNKKDGKYEDIYRGKKIEFSCKNHKLHGKLTGYYENNKILSKGNFKEGKLHGENIEYYENGNIKGKINFKEGIPDGKWTTYYENGKVKQKVTFKDGKKEGEEILYDKTGKEIKKS